MTAPERDDGSAAQASATPVARAERWFRWPLACYPRAFRMRFGEEMRELFRDQCRAAQRHGGPVAVRRLWWRTLPAGVGAGACLTRHLPSVSVRPRLLDVPRPRTGPRMDPMFLPDVEASPKPGPYADMIEQMRRTGAEYPQIWHLFAYLPEATQHLGRFTQEILRGPAPLSPGLRELIAAHTSKRNDCPF